MSEEKYSVYYSPEARTDLKAVYSTYVIEI